MNYRIIENPPDHFEEIYPKFKELLDTTEESACEIIKKFGIACTNNSMRRRLHRAYREEKGFNMRTRKIRIERGEWL